MHICDRICKKGPFQLNAFDRPLSNMWVSHNPLASPYSGIVYHLLGQNRYTLTRIPPHCSQCGWDRSMMRRPVGAGSHLSMVTACLHFHCAFWFVRQRARTHVALLDWLTNRLTDWLTDWLTNYLLMPSDKSNLIMAIATALISSLSNVASS